MSIRNLFLALIILVGGSLAGRVYAGDLSHFQTDCSTQCGSSFSSCDHSKVASASGEATTNTCADKTATECKTDHAAVTTHSDPSAMVQTNEAVKAYPLNTCIVSGAQLGGMGEPVTKVYDGQEIKFCCNDCVAAFEANPERYLAKLKKTKM